VAVQRHRGAPRGVRHARADRLSGAGRGGGRSRGCVRRRRHPRPAVPQLQADRLRGARVVDEQPRDGRFGAISGRRAQALRGLPQPSGGRERVGDGDHGRPCLDAEPECVRRVRGLHGGGAICRAGAVRHRRGCRIGGRQRPAGFDLPQRGRVAGQRFHDRGRRPLRPDHDSVAGVGRRRDAEPRSGERPGLPSGLPLSDHAGRPLGRPSPAAAGGPSPVSYPLAVPGPHRRVPARTRGAHEGWQPATP